MRRMIYILLFLTIIGNKRAELTAQESDAPYIYYHDGQEFVIERADGTDQYRIGEYMVNLTDDFASVGWSPEGQWLLIRGEWYGGTTRTRALRYDGRVLLELPAVDYDAWSPTEDLFVTADVEMGATEANAFVVDLDTQQPILAFYVERSENSLDIRWSPDGRFFAYSDRPGTGRLITRDLQGNVQERSVETYQWIGSYLTYLHPQRHTRIFEEVATGRLIEYPTPYWIIEQQEGVRYSPNNRYALVYTYINASPEEPATDFQVGLLSLDDATYQPLQANPSYDAYWSSDSQWADFEADHLWWRVYVEPFRVEARPGPDSHYSHGEGNYFGEAPYVVSSSQRYVASFDGEVCGFPPEYTWAKCIIDLQTGHVRQLEFHTLTSMIGYAYIQWHPTEDWAILVEMSEWWPYASITDAAGLYYREAFCPHRICPRWLPANVPIED